MDAREALEWLNSREKKGIIFRLENTLLLLERLGDPHKRFRSVHVAGTNGKGSVCAMIASVLMNGGYRTGLYTSPHLVDFRERIQINGEMIAAGDLASISTQVRSIVDSIAEKDKTKEFTFFEITTVIAFEYFSRAGVDIAVIEVGMGGRLDSTNVIEPECSVINTISLEHTEYLGDSLSSIAAEKAGIIKPFTPTVVIDQTAEVIDVFKRICKERSAPLVIVGRDVGFRIISSTLDGTEVAVDGMNCPLFIPLVGSYQGANAALAFEAINQLMKRGLYLSDNAIIKGMAEVRWPGRLEVVSRSPLVIFDATHTPDGARAVSSEISRLIGKDVILVIGVLKDKDIDGICRYFGSIAKKAIATAPQTDRAFSASDVEENLRRYVPDVLKAETIAEALEIALKDSSIEDTVLVTGSLYTLGEARRWWDERQARK